jgi:hypothetical protein
MQCFTGVQCRVHASTIQFNVYHPTNLPVFRVSESTRSFTHPHDTTASFNCYEAMNSFLHPISEQTNFGVQTGEVFEINKTNQLRSP